MPSLLSGGKALKGTYGTSTIFITLPTAQLSLGVTPTNNTGYTLVTGPNGQLGFTSTLGGVYFKDSVIQTNTPNGDITIQSTGTGRLNLNGNVFINGNNALISTSTFIDLTVLEHAIFASTTTNVVFDAGLNIAKEINLQGSLNAFGNVFLSPYNGVVTISPTGIGSVDISPETLGAMDNVAIGTRQASSATFTTVEAASYTLNGAPLGSGAATISDTPPPDPYVGKLWWDSTIGVLRVYYSDGDSGQWVDAFPVVEGPQGEVGPQGPAGVGGSFSVTTSTLFVNNSTPSTSTATGALRVLGGVGVGGSLYAGNMYSNGAPVLTAVNTSWFGVSQILVTSGLSASTSTGVVTLSNTDTLELLTARGSSTPSAITITNQTSATSTTTGALTIAGGVGVGGSIYVRDSINIMGSDGTHGSVSYNDVGDTFEVTGNIVPKNNSGLGSVLSEWSHLYANEIFENGNRVVTSMKPTAGAGISIEYASTTGPIIAFTITNLGVKALLAGTDTAISSALDNSLIVWNTSTLETVTSRGARTPSAITITNSTDDALNVTGTIKAGGAYVNGSRVWTEATLVEVGQLGNSIGYLTSSTIGGYGVSYLTAGAGIELSGNTGTITIDNIGVLSVTAGSGISLSTSTGNTAISSVDTLALVTSRGATTPQVISITTSSAATTSTNGALRVVGGVGIGGSLYAGNIYDNGNRVLNKIQINVSPGLSGGGTITGPNATVNLVNTGVITLTADTDTSVTSTTGNIRIWNISTLQSISNRGNQTSNAMRISNTTSSISTTTGALRVDGGVGIQGNLYASAVYDSNSRVITLATLGNYGITELKTGPGIAVTSSTGVVTVSSTATLELVTSFGSTTPSAITITNATASTDTNTGALRVAGGVGVGGNIHASDIYDNNVRVVTRINPQGSTYIGVSGVTYNGPQATFTIDNIGVQSLANGTDTTVSATTGSNVQINVNSTLQTVTARGAITDQAIRITNTSSSITSADGALVVNGGVGVGENVRIGGAVSIAKTLQVTGDVTFNSNVTFNGTATYVLSTNTYYTDNLLELHVAPGGVGTPWGVNDGKDIGIRLHYFDTVDKNAALVMANDTRALEWYSVANETLGTVSGTYGSFKTGSIQLVDSTSATNTTSGALQVEGGVGIGGALYAGGVMYSAGSQVITANSLGAFGVTKLNAGPFISVTPVSGTGTVTVGNLGVQTASGSQYISVSTSTGSVSIINLGVTNAIGSTYIGVTNGTGTITISNLGVQSLTAGGETTVSASTGSNVSITVTSTLQDVTSRGTTTTSAISIINSTSATDTVSGALTVTGGVGIGGALYVGGTMYASGAQVVTGNTIGLFGVSKINAGPAISIDPSFGTGTVTIGNLGVHALSAGTDTVINSTTGTVTIWNNSTLQTITNRGATTNNILQLTSSAAATDSATGALRVTGGVGVGGNIYSGNKMYAVGAEVITTATLGIFGVQDITAGTGIYVTPSIGTGSVVVTNVGVVTLTAGTDTAISSNTGTVTVWNTSTLQTITNRGTTTTNAINFSNNTAATSTASGALQVRGGVGIGGALYVGGTMYASGAQVVTEATLGAYGVTKVQAGAAIAVSPASGTGTVTIGNLGVHALAAGTDTAISSTTGTITIWNSSTLQTITNRGAVTNNNLAITNNTVSTDSNTGALTVTGGVGVGGNIYSGNKMYAVGAEVITTATLGVFGVRDITAGTGIYVTPTIGTGSVVITNVGVVTLTAGTDTAISSNTGTVTVWNTSTLQSITNRGSITTNAINISNTLSAISTASGALQVRGGAGIGGTLYVGGTIYASGSEVLTQQSFSSFGVSKVIVSTGLAINPAAGIGEITLTNLGVTSLTAGTDTAISSTTGTVTIWNSSTLQSVTNRGAITNNNLAITNGTVSTDSNTGALTVTGGVGVGGNIYSGNKMYAVGAEVITTATIGVFGVQLIKAGTDTAISISTGTVTIWNTSTLQSITSRSNTTTNNINITSTAQSANTNSGQALQVAGGVGVGGNIVIGGDVIVLGNINAAISGVVGTITTASNVAGGGAGYIPIQTAQGVTSFISSGTSGQLLQMQTGNTATFVSTTTMWIGNALTATNAQNVTGGTVRATAGTFTGIVSITNGTLASNTYTAALTVSGGIGAQNAYFNSLNVTQNATFAGNVTFSGSATYVNSTNTVYTDNIIDLHIPPGGIASQWTLDDGKDIGIRFHYYTNSTDTNAALVLANDTKYLEWYSSGTEVGSTFVGTYGGFKTGNVIVSNNTVANSTSSGALQVVGGIGVGGNVYIGGDITVLGTINASVTGVITTASNLSGGLAGGIPIQVSPGVTSFINAGSVGSILQQQGNTTATFVSTTTLVVGQATTASNIVGGSVNATTGLFGNTVNATSTNTGALQVVGGLGVNKDVYVGGNITVVGTINATVTGVATTATNLSGGSVNATTGAFSGTVVISNASPATSTASGALQVVGGTGIGGNLYVGGQIVGGSNSTVSAPSAAIIGGLNNSASGTYSLVGNGQNNTASGAYSRANGKGATARGITNANAFGYNFSTAGDAQQVSYLLSVATTNAISTNLTADQAAAGAINQIIMPNNSAYGFKGMITARDTTNGWLAVWEIRGGIRRAANASTTTLVGVPVVDRIAYDSAASTWTVAVVADTTNGGVQFQVTGAAATNIHWVANMTTIEVA